MTIQQIIDLSKNGELKNLAVGKDEVTVLGFLNVGLIELYKRFSLNVKEYIITLVEGKTIYDMPDDYMWVTSAYGEVEEDGNMLFAPIPINTEDNPESLNTIGFSQVQIPTTTTGAFISIIYVSAPPYCLYDATAAEGEQFYYLDGTTRKYDLPIPPQLVEPLLDYFAYRANKSLGEVGKIDSDSNYQLFEAGCARIEQRGMISSDDMNMDNRNMKGFI